MQDNILKIVQETCNNDTIALESDLFGDGYLDSLGTVALLLTLERELGVAIPITQIDRSGIFTVRTIAELIQVNSHDPS